MRAYFPSSLSFPFLLFVLLASIVFSFVFSPQDPPPSPAACFLEGFTFLSFLSAGDSTPSRRDLARSEATPPNHDGTGTYKVINNQKTP